MLVLRRLGRFYRLQLDLIWHWRPGRRALIRRGIVSFGVAFIAFAAAAWVVPGIVARSIWAIALAVICIWLLNALVRPVILALVAGRSVILVGLFAVLVQVLVILALNPLVPGLEIEGFGSAFVGSWIFAVVNTVLTTVLSIDRDDSFYGTLVRNLARTRPEVLQTEDTGVVIVQVDGLSHPVLVSQIRAGRVPVLSEWVRSGGHRLERWVALLPTQTSASQAGILHGNNDDIPAFRWYEKESNRLLVSNHPADAAEIVRRISNGEGLLSANGSSVGNLVSGDAVRSYMTMATLTDPTQGLGKSDTFFGFFLSPYNYLHSTVVFVGETLKELIQARRQRLAGIVPRMHRGFPYPFVRAATNVVLRSISTSLVMEEMFRGVPVIYVDYTDYDEIAHHSGPERPEALDALHGVDRQIGILAKAARDAPRPYRFVVLSDHGQSLGATFSQRYGTTLESLVRELMGGAASVRTATARVEEWGPINAFLSEFARSTGASAAVARRALRRRTADGVVNVARTAETSPPPGSPEVPDLVVCASGNLALIYFTVRPMRLTIEDLNELYPGLVEALSNHPGIGLLMIRSAAHDAIAVGRQGIRYIDEDRVTGQDPVAPYGPHAVASLKRANGFRNCPDVLVVSILDPEFDEVAAFEELIGSHGGLGGWQTQPFLLHPADWEIDVEPLVGAPAVYGQIRRWLESIGIRLGRTPAPGPVADDGRSVELGSRIGIPEPAGAARRA